MNYINNEKYEGDWKNDKREGKGKLIYSKGIYDGEWKDNLKNGNGKIYNTNKIISCNFINDKMNGNAIIKFKKNNNYYIEVKFKDDKMIEKGIYYFNNGNKLIGFLDENYNINKGKMIYSDGYIYEGEFNNNFERHGKGFICSNIYDNKIINDNNLLFDNNDIKNIFNLNIRDNIFKGNFIKNKKNGKGLLYMKYKDKFLQNNTIFIGEFKDNNRKGNDIIYFINDSYFEAYWKNDDIIDENKFGKFYLNDLKVISKKCNIDEWIKIIKKELLINYGNFQVNIPLTSNIR